MGKALFQVHRPSRWDDLVGHSRHKRAIDAMKRRGSLGGRAFWLSGPSGIGKTSMAYLIAGDVELRAIIALSRFGGLRTPSEPFVLQWTHIDWDRRRITVPAVKTKLRELPLFPELVPYLQALQKQAEDEYLFSRLSRFSDANLRKQMIRLSGQSLWQKLFQNIRSSRQTELEERFPRKTVCCWMGNSETVADQHYLQVLDEHYERAILSRTSDDWSVSETTAEWVMPTVAGI